MPKTKIAEISLSFGSKIIKFCIKIKNFAQMLSEILAAVVGNKFVYHKNTYKPKKDKFIYHKT